MSDYMIVETDAGLAVSELPPGTTPEEEAARQGGILVDPGPYRRYEDAYDAILAIQEEDEEELD